MTKSKFIMNVWNFHFLMTRRVSIQHLKYFFELEWPWKKKKPLILDH